MPNHVTSILHFNCGAELQKRIYEAIKDDEAGEREVACVFATSHFTSDGSADR